MHGVARHAQVAAQEACAAGATAVVKGSLLQQYDLATSAAAPEHFCEPGQEARILRGLISQCVSGSSKAPAEDVHNSGGQHKDGHASADTPVHAAPATGKGGSGHARAPKASYVELSGYFNQAMRRLAERGADRFFGDDGGRHAPSSRGLLQQSASLPGKQRHCTWRHTQAAAAGVVRCVSVERGHRGRPCGRLHVQRCALCRRRRLLRRSPIQGQRQPGPAKGKHCSAT